MLAAIERRCRRSCRSSTTSYGSSPTTSCVASPRTTLCRRRHWFTRRTSFWLGKRSRDAPENWRVRNENSLTLEEAWRCRVEVHGGVNRLPGTCRLSLSHRAVTVPSAVRRGSFDLENHRVRGTETETVSRTTVLQDALYREFVRPMDSMNCPDRPWRSPRRRDFRHASASGSGHSGSEARERLRMALRGDRSRVHEASDSRTAEDDVDEI